MRLPRPSRVLDVATPPPPENSAKSSSITLNGPAGTLFSRRVRRRSAEGASAAIPRAGGENRSVSEIHDLVTGSTVARATGVAVCGVRARIRTVSCSLVSFTALRGAGVDIVARVRVRCREHCAGTVHVRRKCRDVVQFALVENPSDPRWSAISKPIKPSLTVSYMTITCLPPCETRSVTTRRFSRRDVAAWPLWGTCLHAIVALHVSRVSRDLGDVFVVAGCTPRSTTRHGAHPLRRVVTWNGGTWRRWRG